MPSPVETPACNLVELRQYTLRPGRRDELIELFERELVETQEAVDMTVMGQFLDLDDADRFVWLRGFRDMPARQSGLSAFYGGPVWRAHRAAANATMVESDNVLLLRPAWPGAGIPMHGRTRAAPGATAPAAGRILARILALREPASDELLALCQHELEPLPARAGALLLGCYVTEPAPNNFPRLPVREGEHVLVLFALFDSLAGLDAFVRSGAWAGTAEPRLDRWLARPGQTLRLVPTRRSAIHA